MNENILTWFTNLPLILQCAGYLLMLPIVLAAIGCLVCFADSSAVDAFPNKNLFITLILLGFHASIYFVSIFGSIAILYNIFALPYWLAVSLGLFFGLVCVPLILVYWVNRKRDRR